MTVVEEMAEFVARASVERLSPAGRLQLKVPILHALGCAIENVRTWRTLWGRVLTYKG
jgi:hypothetical protein